MKEIKNFEELYQVNELGQIWSIKNKKYLKQTLCKNGYLYVGLHKNKIRKNILVHRIVAEAFIPNPNNLPEVNHKDENPQNNSVNNLEWCDSRYNKNYGTSIQRRKEKLSKKVYQYTLDGELVREWISATEAGRNGFSQSNINNCCLGKAKTYKGFRWSYKKLEKII